MQEDLNEQLDARIRSFVPAAYHGRIPPPVLEELGIRWTELVEGERLRAFVPAQEKFANPMGTVQGGIIAAALDGAYGTLTFLAMNAPATSITLDTSFVRPLPVTEEGFELEVRITARTRTMIYLDGVATNPAGKIIATSKSVMMLLDSSRADKP